MEPSRYSLGYDREAAKDTAALRARRGLLSKGLRKAKKDKDYAKAVEFSDKMYAQGTPYGAVGSAADAQSIGQGRAVSRDALVNQMRGGGVSRAERISAAKSDGTFGQIRQNYNAQFQGKFEMDEAGNIKAASSQTKPDAPTGGAGQQGPVAPKPDKVASTGGAGQQGPVAPKPDAAAETAAKALAGGFAPDKVAPVGVAQTKPVTSKSARESLVGALKGDRIKDPELEKKLVPDVAAPASAMAAAPSPKTPAAPAISQKPSMSLPRIALADTPKPAMPDMSEVSANMTRVKNDISRAMYPTRSTEELLKGTPSFLPTVAQPKKKDAMVAARAKGGPVKAGKPYLVGEEGPEIMVPEEDGEIVPNKDLKKKSRRQLRKMLSKK